MKNISKLVGRTIKKIVIGEKQLKFYTDIGRFVYCIKKVKHFTNVMLLKGQKISSVSTVPNHLSIKYETGESLIYFHDHVRFEHYDLKLISEPIELNYEGVAQRLRESASKDTWPTRVKEWFCSQCRDKLAVSNHPERECTPSLTDLVGKTITSVTVTNDHVTFCTDTGKALKFRDLRLHPMIKLWGIENLVGHKVTGAENTEVVLGGIYSRNWLITTDKRYFYVVIYEGAA